jgi:hypothetical protein
MLRDTEERSARRHFLRLIGVAGVVASVMPVDRAGYAAETHERAVVAQAAADPQSRTELTLQTTAAFRDLWVDHIFWVRSVSLAVVDGNDAAMDAADERVIANAQSIAASIEPFYGESAKGVFFNLLGDHYRSVKTYLAATMSSNVSLQATATQTIISNAEEIAVFLSEANPYLPKDEFRGLLLAHGGHHIEQIQELAAHNFVAEAKTWESMKIHVYQIADAIADALRKQFPNHFLARQSE